MSVQRPSTQLPVMQFPPSEQVSPILRIDEGFPHGAFESPL
jgi:hypothetical protein